MVITQQKIFSCKCSSLPVSWPSGRLPLAYIYRQSGNDFPVNIKSVFRAQLSKLLLSAVSLQKDEITAETCAILLRLTNPGETGKLDISFLLHFKTSKRFFNAAKQQFGQIKSCNIKPLKFTRTDLSGTPTDNKPTFPLLYRNAFPTHYSSFSKLTSLFRF